jgi:hypothetical protein
MQKLVRLIQWNKRNSLEKIIIVVVGWICFSILFKIGSVIINAMTNSGFVGDIGEFIIGFAIFLLVFVAPFFWIANNQKRRVRLLKQYEEAKEALRKNPNSSKLREKFLESGRAYYASLRDGNILTIYDEQALNNDLSTIIGTNPDEDTDKTMEQ